MADEEKETTQQPIIVKKVFHGGHHGGAWKVAYADFMTAMMAFFLVMWIVGQSAEIRRNVAGYFRDPVGFSKGGSKGILPGGKGPYEKEPGNTLKKTKQQRETETWESLKEVGRKISTKLQGMENFSKFKNQIEIGLVPEGLRIQLIEASANSSFFESGSADMSREGEDILKAISSEIAKLSYLTVIEGHTDSRKFPVGAKYTNWELSADRANTARRVMLNAGMDESRIKEIRGFAANQPRIKDDPFSPSNRRIAIIILNEYASSDYDEITVSSEKDLSLN